MANPFSIHSQIGRKSDIARLGKAYAGHDMREASRWDVAGGRWWLLSLLIPFGFALAWIWIAMVVSAR